VVLLFKEQIMSLFLAVFLACYDPYPWMPPQEVCNKRHTQATQVFAEANTLYSDAWNVEDKLALLGGTAVFINENRMKAVREERRIYQDNARQLAEFWENCQYYHIYRLNSEWRHNYALQAKEYLGDVTKVPRWWSNLVD
jgi:hypothetical protein